MDSEDLRAFRETVRTGSFSLAAQVLGLSQSAVSRRVRHLEAEAGARLLDRARPRVTPTRPGLGMLEFANRTLAGWDELLRDLDTPHHRDTLNVACSNTPGQWLLPSLLAAFGRQNHGVRAHLHVWNSQSVEECVRRRHCDVGFLGRAPREPGLEAVVVGRDHIVLAVGSGHRWAGRSEIDLAELDEQSLVVREQGSATEDTVRERLAQAGHPLRSEQVAAELGSAAALVAAIAAGEGAGFLSSLAVEAAPRLRALQVRGLDLGRDLYMIHARRGLSPTARAFVAYVRAHVPLHPASPGRSELAPQGPEV